jgi:glycerate 2-kinase
MDQMRSALLNAFLAAVNASQPETAVREVLRSLPRPAGRTVVVGGGKAAASMAIALEKALGNGLQGQHGQNWAFEGVVVTRYGHALEKPQRIELLEAGHPVPDAASEVAGRRMLEAVQGLSKDDLVIVLISGGGSALMVAPVGVTLEQKLQLNRNLLNSGADIVEINTVRKHLSGLKGGRLALAAAPARVITLIVSDVVGDDLSTIASGPTVPDPTSVLDALEVLERYGIVAPEAREALRSARAETPQPDDSAFARCEQRLIVTNSVALEAAQSLLEQSGFEIRILSDSIVGEARVVAKDHALEARTLKANSGLLSGGETTVTVRGTGLGGRNCEFLLALALELQGETGVSAIACDSDGIDGVSDAAGAIITPDTLERAAGLGLNAQLMLENNDSYSFFAALGDLVVVGPTGTNVNDFRCIIRT